FAKGQAPAALARGMRATIERVHAEAGGNRLYNATTHVGGERGVPTRLVIVNAGDAREWTVERARNVASAGVKALWRSTVKRAAVVVAAGSIGAERAAQATVEGV